MSIRRLFMAGLIILVGAGSGLTAEIQCKRILKYLSTGRSVSDVAETMVISEDDVIACQEEAAEAEKKGEAAEDTAGDKD